MTHIRIIFRLKFAKLRRYMLCGGVVACHVYGVCAVRCVQCDSCRTEHNEQYTS